MTTHFQRRREAEVENARARVAARSPAQWISCLGWELMEFSLDWPVLLAWNLALAGLLAAGARR